MLITWILSTTGLHVRSTTITSNSHRHPLSPSPSQLLGYPTVTYIFYCPAISEMFPTNMLLSPALRSCTQVKWCQAEELTWQFPNQTLLSSENRKQCEHYCWFWWALGNKRDADTVFDIRIPRTSQTSLPFIHETLPGTLMRIVHCQASFTLEAHRRQSKQVLVLQCNFMQDLGHCIFIPLLHERT